jgi:hypothetical protein
MAKLPIPFNNPATYPGHSGVDYPRARGTQFRASGAGVIGLRSSNSRGGLLVWVDYDALPKGAGVGHAHLDNYTDSPPVGTRVGEGTVIGRVGNSGHSTGPHLHAEVNGYSTTDGYWRFFDRNRVVGAGGGGGGGTPAANQRIVGANGANGRKDPSTTGPVSQTLPPGTVADFNGWIRGQVIEGNGTWFRGAHSGDFFWSGGFTNTGVAGLADLNPPPTATNQRTVGPNGANGRPAPNTSGPITQTLPPGTVGDFDAWTKGQDVEGNTTWIRGQHSGDWFWSGGFTSQSTDGLPFVDLNPPVVVLTRTVGANPANVRRAPYTSSAAIASNTSGTVVPMAAFAHAQAVEGNDVWFQRLDDKNWMWSGGFVVKTTEGLPEVPAPAEPGPANPYNPMGLKEYPPVYPRAVVGLEAPLGFVGCNVNGLRASRKTKGTPAVPTTGVISLYIIHWAWPAGDDTRFFSTCNSSGSCPTQYINAEAKSLEFIRPGAKPASTGSEWNWRSWAVEVEPNVSDVPITEAQIDEIIEQIVFLREHDGKELDGALVDFKIDRAHVIADRDTRETECPGDYLYGKIPEIIVEAQRRYDERHPAPEPEPGETVTISRVEAEEALAAAQYVVGVMTKALE